MEEIYEVFLLAMIAVLFVILAATNIWAALIYIIALLIFKSRNGFTWLH